MPKQPKLKQFEFDSEKLKEMIVYVAAQAQDDPTFGAIKLNKILYYADFAAYRQLGAPITGAAYFKLREGPAPRQLLAARDELLAEGRLQIEQRRYFAYAQKRPVLPAGCEPDSEFLRPEEREIVDEVIEFFWGKSAREVSDYSHREPGWILADDRADIPYESAWLSADPIDQETEETALKLGAKLLENRGQ